MLSWSTSKVVRVSHALKVGRPANSVVTQQRPLSRFNGTTISKRWHTHVEEVQKKPNKKVEDLKAAVEARLASTPEFSDFMASSSPEGVSGTLQTHLDLDYILAHPILSFFSVFVLRKRQ